VGLHPTHLFEMEVDEAEVDVAFKSRSEEWDAAFYEKLAKNKKVVAVGEIGLDYNFAPKNADMESVKKRQQEVFRLALDSADKLNLPVIIHSRDTHDDIIPILKEYLDAGKLKRKGVLHCYTGGWKDAKRYLDLDFLISFTGIITFTPKPKQVALQKQILEAVEKIPLQKIMVETDSPYLAPEPFRGKRNEPLYVKYVARKIAEIKGLDFEEVAETTTKTAKKFFQL
jgi:TatD DNase family protein